MNRLKKCGNPGCSCSTDIAGMIGHGWGELSFNGFWEFPCAICNKLERTLEKAEEIRHECLVFGLPDSMIEVEIKHRLGAEGLNDFRVWRRSPEYV